ncbi:spore coat protein U domain-containing protein, partial [Pseudomonas aeruginosa]|nr:spore coat protein U domain-containing protein [Pseudomonas aeruginosa]
NLYSDRPGGIVWDNTTGVAAPGNGNAQWCPLYGRVPAPAPPGPPGPASVF